MKRSRLTRDVLVPRLLRVVIAADDWPDGRAGEAGFPEPRERSDRPIEQVAIIDGLWRTPLGKIYSFEGRYYRLTDSPALPSRAKAASVDHQSRIVCANRGRSPPVPFGVIFI